MRIFAHMLMATFMACPVLSSAQQIPLFEFTMYFEDSIGNQDSVILGYDPTSDSNQPNTQFGEIVLSNPFDSIFEVRVIHGDDVNQERTLKKAIEHVENSSGCELPFHSKIVFSAKFPPVKITYDSTLFPLGSCRNVILSPEWNIFFLQQWWKVCEYHCMADTSTYVEDFVIPPPAGFCGNRLYVEKEVEGQGLKMLPGLFFATFYGPGPCNDTTFLAVKDGSSVGFGTLNPNPAREHFSIQVPTDSRIEATVTNLTGRIITCPFTVSADAVQFDISALLSGIYFVVLQNEHSRRAVYKFIKV